MAAVPLGLITVPFIENVNKFQIRSADHLQVSRLFLIFLSLWLGIGACLPIDKAISLGFW
jgi:cytochrome b6-f complex subunit 4